MMKNKRLYVLLAFAALAFLRHHARRRHGGTNGQDNSTPQQALDKRQDAFQADEAKGVHASYQSGVQWSQRRRLVVDRK